MVHTFAELIIARAISGCGMGMIDPVGFALVVDLLPAHERNAFFAFLAIFETIANGFGNSLSAFTALGWAFPFLILGIISVVLLILSGLMPIPRIGAQDEELGRLRSITGADYQFRVTRKDIPLLFQKPSNLFLTFMSFFQIIPGTVLLYMMIITFANPMTGFFRYFPPDLRIAISTVISGLVGVGYIIGTAVIGNPRRQANQMIFAVRRKRTFIALFIAIPFLIAMIYQLKVVSPAFVAAQNYPTSIPAQSLFGILFSTIGAIFAAYPQYILFLICALIGSFLIAAPSTNRDDVVAVINLPEHGATASSLVQDGENIGKTLTLFLVPEIVGLINNYQLILSIAVLFLIPTGIFWYLIYRHVEKDLEDKELLLNERAQISILDFFLALDRSLDQGIYLMDDAKRSMLGKPKQAEILIDKAISAFKSIYATAEKKDSLDLKDRTMNLLDQALVFKSDLLLPLSQAELKKLNSLFEKIDSIWEKSDIGTLEAISEQAYLKIYEARMKFHFNPFETAQLLSGAIELYAMIIQSCDLFIEDNECKRQSAVEHRHIKRFTTLRENAKKWHEHTVLMHEHILTFIHKLTALGFTEKIFFELTEVFEEYQIEFLELVGKEFDARTVKRLQKMMKKQITFFLKYEKKGV